MWHERRITGASVVTVEGIKQSANHYGRHHKGEQATQRIGDKYDAVGWVPVFQGASLYADLVHLHQQDGAEEPGHHTCQHAKGALQAVVPGEKERDNCSRKRCDQSSEQVFVVSQVALSDFPFVT